MSDVSLEGAPANKTPQPRWWRLFDALALVVILPAVVAETARWWWIGDLYCHFRLPYAIALAILATGYAWLRRWRWLAGVLVLLAINAASLWPLYAPQSPSDATGQPLRLMTANVFVDNRQSQPIIDLVRREHPDLVLLIEADDRWVDDLHALDRSHPYQLQVTRESGFGALGPFSMVLFSRLPLVNAEVHRHETVPIPTITAQVSHAGEDWTLIGVHPFPPVSADRTRDRDRLLADVAEFLQNVEGPKIVLGDLNITRWSPQFANLLRVGGLRDSEVGFGYQPTWPDWLPWPVLPIDHVLVSSDVTVIDRRVGPSIASDHRPVIVDVALPRPSQAQSASDQ